MAKCESCRKEKNKGDGVICECGGIFFLCDDCRHEKMGCNCPKCGEFNQVFDD